MSELDRISFTQGDTAVLELTCEDGSGAAIDITGATFETRIKTHGASPSMLVLDNTKHTIVSGPTGRYNVSLATADTQSVPVGINKEIVTKVTLGSNVTYFHGVGILTVLSATPIA